MTADSDLVNRTLKGDLDGFGELHDRYFHRIASTVTRIVGDRFRAEDVAQEAYHKALESLSRLEDPDLFFPWIRRIAVNKAVEETRRWGRRDRLHTAWETYRKQRDTTSSALDHLVDGVRATEVREAVERLPEKQRAAIVLRFFQGLSIAETAEALGCQEVTVRSNVFRGLRKLGSLVGAQREETS